MYEILLERHDNNITLQSIYDINESLTVFDPKKVFTEVIKAWTPVVMQQGLSTSNPLGLLTMSAAQKLVGLANT